ncbi:MAG: hypothetical protein RRA15_13490, partial [bacterium]|nr:hypothetical protein [bacterium]
MNSDQFSTFLGVVLPGMGLNWRRFDRRNIRRKVGETSNINVDRVAKSPIRDFSLHGKGKASFSLSL